MTKIIAYNLYWDNSSGKLLSINDVESDGCNDGIHGCPKGALLLHEKISIKINENRITTKLLCRLLYKLGFLTRLYISMHTTYSIQKDFLASFNAIITSIVS